VALVWDLTISLSKDPSCCDSEVEVGPYGFGSMKVFIQFGKMAGRMMCCQVLKIEILAKLMTMKPLNWLVMVEYEKAMVSGMFAMVILVG
jgi:hypothetical protein